MSVAGVIALVAVVMGLDSTTAHDATGTDSTPPAPVSNEQEGHVNPWAAGNAAVRAWLDELARAELDRMYPTNSTTTP
jgi:hypothetical protein